MAEATIDPDDRGRAGATAATAATADTAAPHQSAKASRGSVRSLAASTTGQLFEWYEWTAYAVFAPYIAAVMFSNENPVSALLATFAVFAVGFLMRPLGGIVFGRIADVFRPGRAVRSCHERVPGRGAVRGHLAGVRGVGG